MERIAHLGVLCPSSCGLCGKDPETIVHALIKCDGACEQHNCLLIKESSLASLFQDSQLTIQLTSQLQCQNPVYLNVVRNPSNLGEEMERGANRKRDQEFPLAEDGIRYDCASFMIPTDASDVYKDKSLLLPLLTISISRNYTYSYSFLLKPV